MSNSSSDNLTVREREILKLFAEGNTVKDVASALNLSGKTVDSHKSNLMLKLGLHNKAQLVQFAGSSELRLRTRGGLVTIRVTS